MARNCLLTMSGMLLALITTVVSAAEFDLVLRGGRVMDPETGRDGIYEVGISDGRIASISAEPLQGEQVLEVSGLVVAPGFIDLHTHSPTPLGFRYQALDGVTTSLELEAGSWPISAVGIALPQGSPLNYGASTGHLMIRLEVVEGVDVSSLLTSGGIAFDSAAFTQPATPAQLAEIRTKLEQGLAQGGLGIGLLLDYISSAVNDAELQMVFDVAAGHDAPVFVHVRRGLAGDTTGLKQVIGMAEQTGAPVHICHLQHSAMKGTAEFLALIRQARERGVDITTEFFPYNAGTTSITAAVFSRDWQSIFDISYEDVEWAATGERFDKAMWEEKRREEPEGMVIHHYVKEKWTRTAMREPGVMVVTDGTPVTSEDIGVPPQGIGSYSRVLGRYVREENVLDLMTALEKMSLLPAQRMETVAPVFARKGRLQEGADADITIFDPDTVIDRSTYREPFQASVGVRHLLVGGEFVVKNGEFRDQTRPGQLLTGLSE